VNFKNLTGCYFIALLFSGCALISDEYQVDQRKVLNYVMKDLPLPNDAEIIKAPTALLGNAEAISGRIIMHSDYSPAESETQATGWNLVSSRISEEVTLIYSKNGGFATIYISPRRNFGGFFSGDMKSKIEISIVHPDFIGMSE
jgi:hypothetical protein